MKKGSVLLLFLLSLMSLLPAVHAQTDTSAQATVTAALLNVRYGPAMTYGIITRIQRGETDPIIGRNTDSSWWQLNLNGSIGWVNGLYVTATNTTNVPDATLPPCPYTAYMTPQCPTSQTNVAVDTQTFQNGLMIWRSDTKLIYVLLDNGAFLKQPNTWSGEALQQEKPPVGLQQPQMGFGKIWLENDTVRYGLGWATTNETSYTTTIETDAGTSPRPSDNTLYLRLADGRIAILNEYLSTWVYR